MRRDHVHLSACNSHRLFRSSRPDYIETDMCNGDLDVAVFLLFRSSRPDYIETILRHQIYDRPATYCSGLPDRTTLRRRSPPRPPRSDVYCSGLPDRTTLRLRRAGRYGPACHYCSGLPDRTTLRRYFCRFFRKRETRLFRSSRPDYIETNGQSLSQHHLTNCSGLPDRTTLRPTKNRDGCESPDIVPVFQTGLH